MINRVYKNQKRVLLISMPWNCVREPSLGLGILKSVLLNNNIKCDIIETSMKLLRYVKYETYDVFSKAWAINDFIFTHVFEGTVSKGQFELIPKIMEDWNNCIHYYYLKLLPKHKTIDTIMRLRQEIIPRFLDDLVEETDFDSYSMAGFTCLYDQTIASLALARKIKQAYPNMFIAFGGTSLAKPMGPALQRSFPEMDAVAYGDGEPVIVPLLEAACGERHLRDVPNITYRNDVGEVIESNIKSTIDLNDSPAPNYDDFFRDIRDLREKHKVHIRLKQVPVESSRGCWWGEKVHCIFCSLDKHARHYRPKSSDTVISQLRELSERYCNKSLPFRFNDYIMPLENYKDLLPRLEKEESCFSIQYEVKANIRWNQMEQLQRAGVKYIQPGIESFNTALLKYMRKGVTAIQNIFTNFAAMYHKIYCLYNIIWGFPGEKVAYYEAMLKLLPSLYHLFPPISHGPVQLVRFSDLVDTPEKYGMKSLKAHWRYDVLFSSSFRQKNNICLEDICYHYDDTAVRPFSQDSKTPYDIFQHQIIKWGERFRSQKARLSYEENNDGISVCDSRHHDESAVHKFGKEAKLLCRTMFGKICREKELFAAMLAKGIHKNKVQALLNKFCELRVIIKEENKYLWIAFPETFYKSGTEWTYEPDVIKGFEIPYIERQERTATQNFST